MIWLLTVVLMSEPTGELSYVYVRGEREYASAEQCDRALQHTLDTTFIGWDVALATCAPRTAA